MQSAGYEGQPVFPLLHLLCLNSNVFIGESLPPSFFSVFKYCEDSPVSHTHTFLYIALCCDLWWEIRMEVWIVGQKSPWSFLDDRENKGDARGLNWTAGTLTHLIGVSCT